MPRTNGTVEVDKDGRTVIYFLGLFELSTANGDRFEGYSEAKAAELAVQHVNAKNILPGYVLKLLSNDTKVSVY